MIRFALASLVALVLWLAAGCGAEEDEPATPGEPETSLEIAVWPDGEGTAEPQRYTLSCDPPSGDHPDPGAACAALARLGPGAFAPVPADAMCTQVFGGPMQARVVGRVAGEQVDAVLTYSDGCQIARWDNLQEVVPRPGGEPA